MQKLLKIDDKDIKILRELVSDASQSVPHLSKKLNMDSSVVYSRIKRMIKLGYIEGYTVQVRDEMLGWEVLAIIGINAESKKRDSVYEALYKMPEIRQVNEVTGRYDFLAFLKAKTIEDLHTLITDKVGVIEGVNYTETFISLRSKIKSFELLA